ncbi:MAG: putative phospholipid-binding lipoprotein MlaA precursor [Lentisphaerae bacterium ADurb.Bin082]|nr:MAG: putative phospholipid-binding lipoprotein MlaA precursor [Lentisphaerae bacterium ADurb.Bin082]
MMRHLPMRDHLCHSLWFCFALGCLLFAGTSRSADSAPTPPPGVGLFCQPLDAEDHLEGFNRSVHLFNQGLVSYVLYPVGVSYNFLVPEIARTSIANCGHNLLFPVRLVNTCLQGKFQAAWEETMRFGVNSTVGILGFRDQASRWGMPSHDEDFGQTMGHYGLKQGFFINLPFLGPSSSRDLLGRILDTPFNLAFWLFNSDAATAVNAATYTNTALSNAPALKQIFDSQDDTYRMAQALYLLDRETKVRDFPLPEIAADPDESFGFVALRPRSTTFFQRGTTRNLKLPGAWQKLPYSFWKAKANTTKMLVILPGVGSHRLSAGVLALAELMQTNGWNVITLSSTLHPDFFLGLPGNDLPGDFRRDAESIRLALTHAIADFSQLYPKQAPSSISVLGYSLGAVNALFLAAQEGGVDSGQLPIDRYVAINPPVDPIHALRQIDQFFDIPKNWSDPEQRAEDVFMRLNAAMFARKGQPPKLPPITREESQFLIGFNLRLALADAICASQKRHNLGLLHLDPAAFRRSAVHTEALGVSYMTYAQDYILPQARQQQRQDAMTASELAEGLSLRAIADCLKNNRRITVLHNRNDFLLGENDLDWLASKLGDRLQVFPAGGHLGNLHLPEYQALLTTVLP